jgi:hypothetical protein
MKKSEKRIAMIQIFEKYGMRSGFDNVMKSHIIDAVIKECLALDDEVTEDEINKWTKTQFPREDLIGKVSEDELAITEVFMAGSAVGARAMQDGTILRDVKEKFRK